MARVGGRIICGICLALLVMGCRTPQPVLKPTAQPEVLTVPPKETRFNQSGYPDVAYRGMDSKFAKPLDSGGGGIIPARNMTSAPGMSGPMSPGGMGSGSGYR